MKILIEDKDLQIVFAEQDDIPFIVSAEQNQENAEFVTQWSVDEHKQAQVNPDVMELIIKKSGEKVGFLIVRNGDDGMELARCVVTAKGKGIGQQALALITKWCFEKAKAHRVWLDYRDGNPVTPHISKKVGFRDEARLKQAQLKNGKRYDLIIMGMLKDEYEQVKKSNGDNEKLT